jgi:cysteine synthase A
MVGNTPLIKLRRASEETGCNIYGKAEFLNPGQSVKDRIAISIIDDAIKRKQVEKGGFIVEGTAGNTGIGMTLIGAYYGLKSIVVIPRSQSTEKKEILRILGAQIVEVAPTRYADPNHYTHYAQRLADVLNTQHSNGAVWANQFDNIANRQAHIDTTAEEIWRQTSGEIDGFICSVGSGGTLAGVSLALKAKNPNIQIGLVDPMGSSLYDHYAHGELKSEGSSAMEGIGQSRITNNLEGATIDQAYRATDSEAMDILYALAKEEGLFLGGSSGINLSGAIQMAKNMGKGNTIVTALCDHGTRYMSKIFNPAFHQENQMSSSPSASLTESETETLPDVFL